MVELCELLVDTVAHADWAAGQERHRCDDYLRHHRPRRHRAPQDPRGPRRLPRRRAVVHPRRTGHPRRGPGPSGLLRLQRPRVPGAGGGSRGRRPRRRDRVPHSARQQARPGARRPRIRPGPAYGLHPRGRRSDPRRRAGRVPLRRGWELGATRCAPGPVSVLEGHRQRAPASGRGRHRRAAHGGTGHLRHRFVLVLGIGDGRGP
jgi:hypothetical protein